MAHIHITSTLNSTQIYVLENSKLLFRTGVRFHVIQLYVHVYVHECMVVTMVYKNALMAR